MIRLRNKLYLITDENLLSRRTFLRQVQKAVAAGAQIVQLREKATRIRDRLELAKELAVLLHQQKVKLIINDDPSLAKLIGADGVHLGKHDPALEEARAILGQSAIIGVSCYGDIQRALKMEKRGASYVSFGACFSSPTKPKEPVVPLSIFGEAKQKIHIPIVAIGGIKPDNARQVIEAGADCLAIVSSVFGATNIAQATQNMKKASGGKNE